MLTQSVSANLPEQVGGGERIRTPGGLPHAGLQNQIHPSILIPLGPTLAVFTQRVRGELVSMPPLTIARGGIEVSSSPRREPRRTTQGCNRWWC